MLFFKVKNVVKNFHLEKKGVFFLNIVSFSGAFNDNFFKYLTLFFCLDVLGNTKSADIFTWVGTASGLPFLLFSSASGLLADHFSKRKIIVILKTVEIFIVALAALFFSKQAVLGSLFILFILATQSAVFGPSKYSIIPELTSKGKINRANGIISSFTYLAIIIGTFIASLFLQLTNKHFSLLALFGVLIAIIGWVSSLFIPKTKALLSQKKPSPFFFQELYKSWQIAKKTPFLRCALLIGSFFLFVGAFMQLNLIPFARESLHLAQVSAGHLFLCSGLGLAVGAYTAGKVSGDKPEIGLCSLGALGLAIAFTFLGSFVHEWKSCVFLLFFLGVSAGLLIVPFQVFIQYFSPKRIRGEMFGLDNFLSFVGAFLAPFFLYLLRHNLQLNASRGFTIIGILIFIIFIIFTLTISGYFFHMLAKWCVKPLDKSISPSNVIICKDIKKKRCFSLFTTNPRSHFYLFKEKKEFLDPLYTLLSCFDYIYTMKSCHFFLKQIKKDQRDKNISCLIFKSPLSRNHPNIKRYLNAIKKNHPGLSFVDI